MLYLKQQFETSSKEEKKKANKWLRVRLKIFWGKSRSWNIFWSTYVTICGGRGERSEIKRER